MFRYKIRLYGELLTPRPNSKLEDHYLSVVRDCLIQYIRSYPPYWRPFLLHPQPEDAPRRGNSDLLVMGGNLMQII